MTSGIPKGKLEITTEQGPAIIVLGPEGEGGERDINYKGSFLTIGFKKCRVIKLAQNAEMWVMPTDVPPHLEVPWNTAPVTKIEEVEGKC